MLDAQGDDKMIPFVISERWEDPEVKDITLFREVFKTNQENLRAFNLWNTSNQFARPFALPPDSPDEALGILRGAFKATINDKSYIADLQKAKLTRDYVSGEEVERYIEKIYSIPAGVKARLDFTVKRHRAS
jgi:hypothetical protein